MRVAVIATNGHFDKQILRLVTKNNINGDIQPRITPQVIQSYDCLILSYKNEMPNMPIVLEQIVLEQKCSIIYITNTTSIGQFYNVYHDLFMNFVNEITMEVELPVTIKYIQKFMKQIQILQTENEELQDRLETLQLTNKAKRILMKKGLSEENSHQFIQQKSMDLRKSKKQVVNLIIKNKIDF